MKRLFAIIFFCGLTLSTYASLFEVHVPMSGRQTFGEQRAPLASGHFSTTVHEIDAYGHAYCPGEQRTASYGPSRAKRVEEDDHSDDPYLMPAGDIPWIMIMLLALAFGTVKKIRSALGGASK